MKNTLKGDDNHYRALGLYIELKKYYEVNISNMVIDTDYDFSKIKTEKLLKNKIKPGLKELVDYFKTTICKNQTNRKEVLPYIMKKSKLVSNKTFYSLEELKQHPAIAELLDSVFPNKLQ